MLASGCRWSRCRFCNLRQKYVPFPTRAVCDAIRRRSRATGISKVFRSTCRSRTAGFSAGSSESWKKTPASYLFGAMFRCDIRRKDLIRFRKNGLDICHLGIESYGDRLLQKMNKGVRLIDIAKTLITCVEEGIRAEEISASISPGRMRRMSQKQGGTSPFFPTFPCRGIISYKLAHGASPTIPRPANVDRIGCRNPSCGTPTRPASGIPWKQCIIRKRSPG